VLQQRIAIGRQTEEPVGLRHRLDRLAVHRAALGALEFAFTVYQITGKFELFTTDAVRAFVGTLVNMAGILESGQEVLNPRGVPLFGRADEVVIGSINGAENRLP